MAGEVTAFGYAVPLTVVLAVLALVLALALGVAFYLTVGWSVYRSVTDSRRERAREDLEDALVERLFDPDPEWAAWVADRSDTERAVLEALLDEYLRELDGRDAERLRGLGDALGIPERARRRLETGDPHERVQALTWLTLLRRPDAYEAAEYEPASRRERATAARLLHESGALDSPREGLTLLLSGADEPFTVFGQDTLYRVARDDPAALFALAAEAADGWPEGLLVQVLEVCGHLATSAGTADLAWLTAALEHDSPAVRTAAVRALGGFGWREDLRDARLARRLVADPSPRVRGAAYETLGTWGDERALAVLRDAVGDETDPRALVRGTNALVDAPRGDEAAAPPGLRDAMAWSREQAEYDRVARRGSPEVGG